MMTNRVEDLWQSAPNDGASAPIGPTPARTGVEFEQIMDAWFLERGRSVESELLLERSRKFLKRVMARTASVGERREIRGLIRAIDRAIEAAREEGG